jgi:hypothetical protein
MLATVIRRSAQHRLLGLHTLWALNVVVGQVMQPPLPLRRRRRA